ncbi:hypothetical protein Unana1_06508 [Umbelopsis nana]
MEGPTGDEEYAKLQQLLLYVPFLESIDLSYNGLTDENLLNMRKRCSKLKCIRILGSDLVTNKSLFDANGHSSGSPLESISTLACFDFWKYSLRTIAPDMQFPVLRDLQAQISSATQFEHLQRLIARCQQSLESLTIYWFYQPMEPPDSLVLSNTISSIPKLKKLVLLGASGHTVANFGESIMDLELRGRCSDLTIAALANVRNLRRLSLHNAQVPTDVLRRLLATNGSTLETLCYNDQWRFTFHESMLAPCSRLKRISTLFVTECKLIKELARLYGNTLEQLEDGAGQASSLEHVGDDEPRRAIWRCLFSTTWVNVQSLKINGTPITTEELLQLPLSFPNISYLYVTIQGGEQVPAEVVEQFMTALPNLKGLHLSLDSYPCIIEEECDTPKKLNRLKRTYLDWQKLQV